MLDKIPPKIKKELLYWLSNIKFSKKILELKISIKFQLNLLRDGEEDG